MKFKHKREIEDRFFNVAENKDSISWMMDNSDRILYFDDTLDLPWHIGIRFYYFYNYFYKKNRKRLRSESMMNLCFLRFKKINKFTRGNLNYRFTLKYYEVPARQVKRKSACLTMILSFTYIEPDSYKSKILFFIYR